MAHTAGSSRPSIVILTLDNAAFYNDMYSDFTDVLKRHADIEHITTPERLREALNRSIKPSVILAADESLTVGTRVSLAHETASYVRSGGVLIFMGLFSSFARPPDIKTLFSRYDLPWESGDYHRTTFALNPAMNLIDKAGLAQSYSQKALHLANVYPADAVYLPSDESRIESQVFLPARVGDLTQAPIAFAKVGEGRVGYVGDVNNENETGPVVLRLCGL